MYEAPALTHSEATMADALASLAAIGEETRLRYRFLDLDGEGSQGVLAEYKDGWYYKRNLSPLTFEYQGEQPSSSIR